MVTIVTGLPRSGTSMVMQMLQAGGMAIIYDTNTPADIGNPNGYFEPAAWQTDILSADGKAIKVIVPNVTKTTSGNIIWITRSVDEIYISQQTHGGHPSNSETGSKNFMSKLLTDSQTALKGRNILTLNYTDVIANPNIAAQQISTFVGGNLDVIKMAAAVNPALYRSKVTN